MLAPFDVLCIKIPNFFILLIQQTFTESIANIALEISRTQFWALPHLITTAPVHRAVLLPPTLHTLVLKAAVTHAGGEISYLVGEERRSWHFRQHWETRNHGMQCEYLLFKTEESCVPEKEKIRFSTKNRARETSVQCLGLRTEFH